MPDAAPETTALPPMFAPFTLRGMTLENRVVLSPMCMYSAVDGTANDFHVVHLGSRAQGGAGLVFTEMTDVSPEGRISPGCAGMCKPEHVPAWKRVVDFVHDYTDARIGIQLGHAGRKAATKVQWEGGGPLIGADAWPIIAPSAIPFTPESQVPKPMDRDDMDRVRDAFVRGARMADEAGFDIVELHFAHGYLLSSFISPLTNKRNDSYGGTLEGRMRFPLEILRAVRAVWQKPLSMRISAVDWVEGGTTAEDAVAIGRMVKAAGLDILTVSTGNVVFGARPNVTGLFQTPYSEKVCKEAAIPTMTVGNVNSAAQMNAILAGGRADLCVMAKGHLYDPYFTRHAARGLGIEDPPWPKQYAMARIFKPSA